MSLGVPAGSSAQVAAPHRAPHARVVGGEGGWRRPPAGCGSLLLARVARVARLRQWRATELDLRVAFNGEVQAVLEGGGFLRASVTALTTPQK